MIGYCTYRTEYYSVSIPDLFQIYSRSTLVDSSLLHVAFQIQTRSPFLLPCVDLVLGDGTAFLLETNSKTLSINNILSLGIGNTAVAIAMSTGSDMEDTLTAEADAHAAHAAECMHEQQEHRKQQEQQEQQEQFVDTTAAESTQPPLPLPMREGRTYSGSVFLFPSRTKNLLPRSLDPSCMHTTTEWATLATMSLQIALFLARLPSAAAPVSDQPALSSMQLSSYPRHVFLWLFLFWRLVYCCGLGALLNAQSSSGFVVRMFKRCGLSSCPSVPRSDLCCSVVQETVMRTERDTDTVYHYDSMPTEFNAWLLFQEICNFIISNDCVAYILFALAYYQAPAWANLTLRDAALFGGGSLLLLFNLWLKLHAYVVLKDYSWYWGDFFFFMEDIETVELGFETLPYPMYSIGYIGYYGVALITHSYTVLFVSLAAHISQLLFVYFVERPHSAKIYETPVKVRENSANHESLQKLYTRDLVIFSQLDLFRSGDLLTLIICLYTVLSAILIGQIHNEHWRYLYYVGQALFWRLFHTYGLGILLYLQGKNKLWTRHFIRHGDGLREALQHWKILYNLSITMTYLSFLVCSWRLYIPPESFSEGPVILKHTVGLLFIVLHIWIAVSTYEVRGRLGWFYADFFIDSLYGSEGPLYSGVYRYLESPLLYTFSCWGITLICSSWTLFFLTAFGQVSNWIFLKCVVEAHYVQLYGKRSSEQSRGRQRSLKGRVQLLGSKVKRVGQQMVAKVERLEIIDSIRSKVRQLKDIMGSYSDGNDSSSDVDSGEQQSLRERLSKNRQFKRHPHVWPDDRHTATSMSNVAPLVHEQLDLYSDSDVDVDATNYNGGTTNDSHTKRKIKRQASLDHSTPSISSDVHSHSRSVTETVRLVVKELEDLVDTAKPRVQAIMDQTRLRVANLANAARLEDTLPRDQLPLHMYSLTFPIAKSNEPPVFQLGEPIVIEFTAARETMKYMDWIALYGIHDNFHPDITTSKCDTRWSYVAGCGNQMISMDHASSLTPGAASIPSVSDASLPQFNRGELNCYDDTTTPWVRSRDHTMHFGRTEVDITPSIDDPGLRVVRGRLVFSREQLPWKIGMFEARYHYDGKYVVLARSLAFRLALDIPSVPSSVTVDPPSFPVDGVPQDPSILNASTTSISASEIVTCLQSVVERCLDIDVAHGDMPLGLNESMLDRGVLPAAYMHTMLLSKYQREICKRIVYVIKHIYGIDFSWRVVEMARSLTCLAERIQEAHAVLGSPPSYI
ncbi:hypothetical protein BASA50_000437 [Batrachochytrium salamandrivorans]|uniref:Phosphatidylethanolamine N-methyltransferase n=1 Tax=Batrachochytrium salamandrivorans TaxID=1357716 RepID=A0ABQ8ETR9_9FUNG|nr:hypothetical protein BASA50_000437 [Batrachochytrium salamandrivorans]